MASFTPKGPFEVSVTKAKAGGRAILKDDIEKFCAAHPELAKERGCYVFGFRASKGYKPVYIGKATKSFKQEVFDHHKLNKYSQALGQQVKGTPVLFFVCLDVQRGRVNSSAIDEVESYLIQAGLVANVNLLNDKKTSVELWSIRGVIRGKGKPSESAKKLRQCLNLSAGSKLEATAQGSSADSDAEIQGNVVLPTMGEKPASEVNAM